MDDIKCADEGLRELALFAGAGGGILGGKLLGWRTVCAVEREPYAASVLAQRQNDGILDPFPIWDDVCTFDGRPWRGRVDVVSGGFPCQDISCAGKGAGLDGEQSGLWSQMRRIVGEVRPTYVFVENSPMLTIRGGVRVIAELAALGYVGKWGVIGAAAVGALHQRERTWIVAHTERNEQPRQKPRSWKIGRVGREFKSLAWDRNWEDTLSALRRMDNVLARSVERTDTVRNGQVPAVVVLAWQTLS